ncbi:MAG: hypothetical protein ABUL62_23665 [Myxococcales bacterium]
MVESSGAESPFVSGLGKGREAFHAEVTEFALRAGERTPEDFLRHFSCRAIMRSLEARPMERARIVSQSTGVHEKVAHKMSPDASGESLQIALDEGVTTASAIVKLFQPDDKQRYLERHALWAFDIEGQPWKTTPATKVPHDRAKSYVAYIIERALENLLVSHEEVVHAITVTKLAQCLPKEKLGSIIEASLKTSDKFTEEDLLGAVPPKDLVEYVALDYLWEKVVTPLIAEAHDYAPKPVVLLAGGAKPAEVKASDEISWDGKSMNPPAESSSPTVTDEEIVSEDEILESELTDDELSSNTPTGRKVASAGKK